MYWHRYLKRIILALLFLLGLVVLPVCAHPEEAKLLFDPAEQLIPQSFFFAGEKQKTACKEAINLLWRSFEITPASNTLFQIAEGFDILGQPRKAVALAEQAFLIAAAKSQKDDRQKQTLAFAAQILGNHYRHSGLFKKAFELYTMAQSLGIRGKNLVTCRNLCSELLKEKASLEDWLESENTPEGTSIIVPHANYAITMEKHNGKHHISLPLVLRYKGPQDKKQITLNRLKQTIPMVETFYSDNGIQLHIKYKIADQAQPFPERGNEINIWYEYALTVLGKGKVPAMDVSNWSMFKLNEKKLSKNAAAYSISHEIGHLLGFEHPSMHLGPFHPAVIEFGNRFTRYSLMSYNTINICEGFPDAFFIEAQNKKRLLRPLLRPHSADLAAAKLANACYFKDNLLLKEAISDLKKAFSHAPDKKSVSALLYQFSDISRVSFTQMIEANPNDFYMRLKRSKLRIQKNRWSAAMEDLNRIVTAYQNVGGSTETLHSLRLWPEVVTEALYLRGICLAKLGKQEKAEDDFDAFVKVITTGTELKRIDKIQYKGVGGKLTASN